MRRDAAKTLPRTEPFIRRMATLAAGLICACGVAMYVGLGWSLARPETGAMSGLPAAIQEQRQQLQ